MASGISGNYVDVRDVAAVISASLKPTGADAAAGDGYLCDCQRSCSGTRGGDWGQDQDLPDAAVVHVDWAQLGILRGVSTRTS